MLPEKDGYQILKEIRENNIDSKVIMLTAKSQLEDKLIGFNNGADDYITKPFHIEELLARVNVQLRKNNNRKITEYIEFGDLKLNLKKSNLLCTTTNENIDISCKEFLLLEYFMNNTNIIISKDQIYDKVWGLENSVESNNLEAYLSFIRKKLKIIKNMFNKLGISFTDKLEELSDTDWTNIRILVNIFERNIKPKKTLTSQTGLCKMTIGKTIILLWIDVEKNNYYNFFEDLSRIVLIARTEEGKQPSKEDSISPYLLLTDKKIMGESNNLFEYANWNSEIVKNSFEKISRYKELARYINEFILRLLLTYDKNSKKDMLNLAMFLCEKIINQNYENEDDKDIYKTNYFQIIKRQREFNEDEYDELFKLKENVYKKDNCMLKCGIAILLEDQKDFEFYYNKLSEEFVETLEEVVAYKISLSDLNRLFQTNIELANWGRIIHQDEYRRLHRSHKERLTLPAKERYEEFKQQFPQIYQRVNLGYIASYLGITLSTLSRLRAQNNI